MLFLVGTEDETIDPPLADAWLATSLCPAVSLHRTLFEVLPSFLIQRVPCRTGYRYSAKSSATGYNIRHSVELHATVSSFFELYQEYCIERKSHSRRSERGCTNDLVRFEAKDQLAIAALPCDSPGPSCSGLRRFEGGIGQQVYGHESQMP